MPNISYPHHHVSIRVPWHDAGWTGTVCNRPKLNTACLKLKGIAKDKDEEAEHKYHGRPFNELLEKHHQLPPCVRERATIMADFEFTRLVKHPYVNTSADTHGHFRPTPLRYPAYSAAAIPFRWMMIDEVFGSDKIVGKIEKYPLDGVDGGFEPILDFTTNWVQDKRNQKALLECFWNHIQPEESLVFFYAKQIPLVEDVGRRILIGAGRVKHIGGLTEYKYDGASGDKLQSMLWECMVTHSIRPEFNDGFLLPYHEVLEKSDEGNKFDPIETVAFAPDDCFDEFSYATEHVSNDAAISALLSINNALRRCSELFNYNSEPYEQWVDKELGRIWKKRGPFPGLGAVLNATGVTMGNFIAQSLSDKVDYENNPWPVWYEAICDPSAILPTELARHVDETVAKSWKFMDDNRRNFLELLSRMDLSQEQADMLVTPEERKGWGIIHSDKDITSNPYLVYESTRLTSRPVSIGVVDRGMFPNAFIQKNFPLSEPSLIKTTVDARRLRALVICELESSAQNGNTLRPRDDIIRDMRLQDANNSQRTQLTADLLAVVENELFEGEIRIVKMADEAPAYQLERLAAAGGLIRQSIEKKIKATRHSLNVDWRKLLDDFLKKNNIELPTEPDEKKREELARKEKTAALEEMAASRFSVLIGRAGTGKTTLLSVFCAHEQINQNGVLLLAPTGKARVRMQEIAQKAGIVNCQAFTLAQYLAQTKRYIFDTQRYTMTFKRGEYVAKTVIVDECSMLTEEMMAALIESLSKVDRLIFVGDYRQLPPIGAGRPFVDIVARLQPEHFPGDEPHVATSIAELMIPRRQGSEKRDDLLLASWFGGGETSAGDDQVFDILSGKRSSKHLQFVTWQTPDELEKLLPKILREALNFDSDLKEPQAFGLTLGGNIWKDSIWYHMKSNNNSGAGIAADAWQILSPVRQKPWGIDALNRFIHISYKGEELKLARNPDGYRKIPSPKGQQQIVYGEKVINNRNRKVSKRRMYPRTTQAGYLANGEVGIVVGHRRTKARNWKPENLEVEFSTQPGTQFTFYKSDFAEESEASLELAYALTVHKAQGSEFNTVFLVLPRSPLMVTRELLYTALTRQKDKIVVLLQGSVADLHRFSSEQHSVSARRLTNLFGPPQPVEIKGSFLEERLIHNTVRGELVRSKSEVIIANLLHSKGIDYEYEQELVLDGIPTGKFPDFTIEDDDNDLVYYWEHLGMLGDTGYKSRWEAKEEWYRDNGILPPEENGEKKGILITTRDRPNGSINSSSINRMIEEIFCI